MEENDLMSPEEISTPCQITWGEPDITAAYIFGSLARGRFRTGSDVDVAVLYSPGNSDKLARFERRLDLEIALEEIIRRPVQVIDLEQAGLPLQYQVRKHGRLVVEKDRKLADRFRSQGPPPLF